MLQRLDACSLRAHLVAGKPLISARVEVDQLVSCSTLHDGCWSELHSAHWLLLK